MRWQRESSGVRPCGCRTGETQAWKHSWWVDLTLNIETDELHRECNLLRSICERRSDVVGAYYNKHQRSDGLSAHATPRVRTARRTEPCPASDTYASPRLIHPAASRCCPASAVQRRRVQWSHGGAFRTRNRPGSAVLSKHRGMVADLPIDAPNATAEPVDNVFEPLSLLPLLPRGYGGINRTAFIHR